MSEEFDPYRKWLGIPPEEQPPDHYQLLGIARFEDDPDVIQNAADRQMAHVRTFQSGRHSKLSQKLLNQLSHSKGCLLDGKKKAAYDETLSAAHPTPPDAPPLAEPPIEPPLPPPSSATDVSASAASDVSASPAFNVSASPTIDVSASPTIDLPTVDPPSVDQSTVDLPAVNVAAKSGNSRLTFPGEVDEEDKDEENSELAVGVPMPVSGANTSRRVRARNRGTMTWWIVGSVTILALVLFFVIISNLMK